MNYPPHRKRLPSWFRISLNTGGEFGLVRRTIESKNLHTVCQSAACPNQMECWNSGTATFLILGNVCTRNCRFCAVPKGLAESPDHSEPTRIAEAVCALNLTYAVITSVTRDDLPDGGAGIFAETIRAVRSASPHCRVEVLVPDFQGSESSLKTVIDALPHVLNHNLETVPSLYSQIRPHADYRRSLELLKRAAYHGSVTKTGLMIGLGERREEILHVMNNILDVDCRILTLGQYLQPTSGHAPVQKFYTPEEFEELRRSAVAMGFKHVAAGPLVRSSYRAGEYSYR